MQRLFICRSSVTERRRFLKFERGGGRVFTARTNTSSSIGRTRLSPISTPPVGGSSSAGLVSPQGSVDIRPPRWTPYLISPPLLSYSVVAVGVSLRAVPAPPESPSHRFTSPNSAFAPSLQLQLCELLQ